ncbi:MAG: hypothetical protein AAF569_07545 [Pseudomonadota bacterium]
MTWLWLLLWIGLSSIILGAFLWSTVILFKQKRAWEEFAQKHKLQYEPGRLMESPTVSGIMDKFGVSCFSAMRDPDDMKARRFVSVIEVKLPDGLVGSGAAGTKDMTPFLQSLNLLNPHILKSEEWREEYQYFTSDPLISEEYWTDERVKHLTAVLGVKNADVVFMHDNKEAIIRVETTDPIQKIEKAEKVIHFLIKHAKALLIDENQRKAIETSSTKVTD